MGAKTCTVELTNSRDEDIMKKKNIPKSPIVQEESEMCGAELDLTCSLP